MFLKHISRESVFRNLVSLTVSNILLQFLGFAYRIFLSRMTGPEGMGIYQLIMPFYSFISSLTLTGLTVAVSRLSAARHGVGDFPGARKCATRAFRLFTLSLLIISVLTFIGRRFVCRTLLGDVRTSLALPFLFICLFLTGSENILKNYFYGVGRVAPQITSELSEQGIRFFAVAALLFTFGSSDPALSALLIVLGMVISELSSSFLLHLFFRFEKRRPARRETLPPKARELLSVAVPISASQSINNLLSLLNSSLIPKRLCASGLTRAAATESFGIVFGMTMPLLSFPIAFIASLTSVMVPRMSSSKARADFSDMRRKAAKTVHATGIFSMPLMAIMLPLASPLGELLFSHSSASSLIFPLCIATLISYYEISFGALLNAIGKQKQSAIYIILGGIIQLFFTWAVGIEGIGLRAFAIGAVVSNAITAVLQFLCLCRTLSLSPRFSNWFLSPLLASVLSALLTKIIYTYSASILVSATIGLIAYVIALTALGTNPIRYIKTLIPKNER
ncbi:MAG: oligosaccharide flippase family protein [Oscillospiraceae bacterium]|nr:oligosaccharide flippase family protein [Oscillospiraceae bacterium]